MHKVAVDNLQPGMVVARAIYNAEGQVLLNKGVVLKPTYIVRMKELGVPAVYIRDELVGELEVEDIVSEQTRLEAIKTMKEIFAEVPTGGKGRALQLLDTARIRWVVCRILDDLLDRKELMLNLADIRALDDYTFAHSVNVCILAMVTGLTLNYSRSALLHLGMGALLHDIGKTCIPLDILNKPGRLTMEEYKIVRRHTQYGFDILQMQKGVGPVSALVALEHHERYNGSGYPRGLKGEAIHQFASITGVVDVYDALTADRVYRRAYPSYEAYEMLAGAGNFTHDYRVVKAFLVNVAAYPVGTLVQLNSGDIGVVIGTARGHSCRPRVRLLFRPSGEPYPEQPTLDLALELKYFVTGVVSPGTMQPADYSYKVAEDDKRVYRVYNGKRP